MLSIRHIRLACYQHNTRNFSCPNAFLVICVHDFPGASPRCRRGKYARRRCKNVEGNRRFGGKSRSAFDPALSRSKHRTCGSEFAREEAGTLGHISEGRKIALANKVERHPGRPTEKHFNSSSYFLFDENARGGHARFGKQRRSTASTRAAQIDSIPAVE